MPIPRITSSKLPGSQNPNEPPSELDRSGNSNHIDLLDDVAAEQAARRRAGLCPQCGVVQTHTIVLWGRRRKPIQVCFFIGGGNISFFLPPFSLPGCIIYYHALEIVLHRNNNLVNVCVRNCIFLPSLQYYCFGGNGLGGNDPRC